MIVTTKPSIEGHAIVNYRGIVTSRNFNGPGRIPLQDIEERASALGAKAIVGLNLDDQVLGAPNGMLMVSASGTAVVIA